jgi:hypothetical protein
MMTLDEMKAKADAMRRDRKWRDGLWAAAERHLGLADEARAQREHCEAVAAGQLDPGLTSAEKARNARLAEHWRVVGIGHVRIAAELASASGVDTSGLELPEV